MLYDDDNNKKNCDSELFAFHAFCPMRSPRMRSAYTREKILRDEIKLCSQRSQGVHIIFVMCHQSHIHAYMCEALIKRNNLKDHVNQT